VTFVPTAAGEWTRPGTFEVVPGIHRIPLELPNDGLKAVNVYALTGGGDGVVLVDSGWSIPVAREQLTAALADLDLGLADIERFLVTHVHRDHYSQAVAVRRDFGTRITLGENERETLEHDMNPDRLPLGEHLAYLDLLGAGDLAAGIRAGIRQRVAAMPEVWELPDDWFRDGDVVETHGRRLDVVETPGHTRGHVVFHDAANRVLLAGDHVLPTITPSIGFEANLSPNPLGDFLGSLAKVRAMPDAMLLPAHGGVTDSVHARIDELVAHHGTRLDQTEAAIVRAGVTTALEAAGELRWTRRGTRLADLDEFNQMLAIAETGAHLDLLVAQGRVRVEVVDSVRRYAAA
jgi:glyoxylase-like metal-dependent hydrolase (beta-lactamase superfamily II)